MGEYMKRRESVMMKSTRAMEENIQLNSSKKRKLYSELENEYCSDVELTENSVSPAASRTSGCCKHDDESNDVVKKSLRSPDLENVDTHSNGFETEISTSINGVFSREATPTSKLCGDDDSEETLVMNSSFTPKKKQSTPPEINPRRNIPSEKMPSPAELEEFFAAAEKCEQKRFAEKYNFDITKDIPLEGKYQWVRLRP